MPSSEDAASPEDPVIGILSGMGPYAGLDLAQKIHTLTDAATDQEHLSVALLSYPSRIEDRSAYLSGRSDTNPAHAMADIARRLEAAGATALGIPCNTAHAPAIFGVLADELHTTGHRIRLVHMIEETARHIRTTADHIERVGVLSTQAVRQLGLYKNVLEAEGFTALHPDEDQAEAVNRLIFDEDYGIKAHSEPVTDRARADLLQAVEHLRQRGARAVILGCTELPLALAEPDVQDVLLIDPTRVLARALIRAADASKLLPTTRSPTESPA